MWAKQGQMQIKNLGNTLFVLLGKDGCAKSDGTFGKVPKGGEVIFNQKIYVADFGNFKQGFLSMKFRVRVCFFNNCIEKNQNKTHFEEGSSSHTSLKDGSGYQNG